MPGAEGAVAAQGCPCIPPGGHKAWPDPGISSREELSLVASAQGGEPGTPVSLWAAGGESGSSLCCLIVKMRSLYCCSDLCLARAQAQGQTQALGLETFPDSLVP